MRLSPELQRNLWIEFSLSRVLVMPFTQVVIFYILYCSSAGATIYLTFALGIFALMAGLWGGSVAADSVVHEVNEGTWDFQRLSSLGPFSIALGKLFGATSYAWYGAGMELLVVFSLLLHAADIGTTLFLCGTLVLSGIICHGAALFTSMLAIQSSGKREKTRSFGCHVLGLVAGAQPFVLAAGLVAGFVARVENHHDFMAIPFVPWYGILWPLPAFGFTVALVFALWLLLGIRAQMRTQLQMRSLPWGWAGFVLFLLFFIGGFTYMGFMPSYDAVPRSDAAYWIWASSIISASWFITYGTAFLENWTGMHYRRMQDAWQKHDRRRLLSIMPRWIVSYGLLVVVLLVFGLANAGHFTAIAYFLLALAFTTRDIALLHYFRLAPNGKRALAATIFWLAMLYYVFPALLFTMGLGQLAAILLPFWNSRLTTGEPEWAYASLIVTSLEAIYILWLVRKRWRLHWAMPARIAG